MSSSRCAIALHRSSPTWHRRARTRRSAARRKLQAGGVPTRENNFHLLIGHHGTCEASRVSLQANTAWYDQRFGSPSHNGKDKHGCRRTRLHIACGLGPSPQRSRKPPGRRARVARRAEASPAMRSRRLPDTQAMASVAASAQAGSSGMVSRVQQALNHARKAEARVKKLNADKEKPRTTVGAMGARHEGCVAARESAVWPRHGADRPGDCECHDSPGGSQNGRCALRFETSAPEDTEVPAAMEVEIEDGAAEWFALRHSWEQEAKPDWEGVLERALGHRRAMEPARESEFQWWSACQTIGWQPSLTRGCCAAAAVDPWGLCRPVTKWPKDILDILVQLVRHLCLWMRGLDPL